MDGTYIFRELGDQCVIALQNEQQEILPIHESMGFNLKEQNVW